MIKLPALPTCPYLFCIFACDLPALRAGVGGAGGVAHYCAWTASWLGSSSCAAHTQAEDFFKGRCIYFSGESTIDS